MKVWWADAVPGCGRGAGDRPSLLRLLTLAPWRRAPARILRWPSLLFGIATAALILGVAVGSRPMFVSSSASAALASDLEDGCRFSVGLGVRRSVSIGGDDLAGATSVLRERVDARDLDVEDVVTVFGDVSRVVPAGGGDGIDRVQLLSRSRFERHIDVVERGPAGGVWLPDTVTESLDIEAGDEVRLASGSGAVPMVVSGVFRDLVRDVDGQRDPHWCSVASAVIDEYRGRQPPPVALLEQDDLLDTLAAARTDRTQVWWEFAPTTEDWTLDRAERVIGGLRRLAEESNNRASELHDAVGAGRTPVDQLGTVRHARRTSSAVDGAAGPVALGTAGVALIVLLGAGRTWLDRRRQEVTVLAMRGAGPLALGLKAVLEMSVPLVGGAAAGVLSAHLLVRAIGPNPMIEAGAVRAGAFQTAGVVVVAVVVIGTVVGAATRRIGLRSGGVSSRPTLLWWEPPVLALAAAALYEIRSGDAVAEGSVDALVLVFPLMLMAGGAGLAARVVLSPRVGGWLATHLPAAGWLAARRLVASRLRAAAIVTGTAVAIGIVCFGSSMSSSLLATAEAKALLGPGAHQVVRLSGDAPVPERIGADGSTTLVSRTSELGVVRRGHPSADVLGVDPATFADGAFWDSSFAGESLDSLLSVLEPRASSEAGAPVIVVGDEFPAEFTLTLAGTDDPVELDVAVRARADAFPGLGFRTRRPLVVIDDRVLAEHGVDRLAEVWADDAMSTVPDQLTDAGHSPIFVTRAGTGSVGSRVQSQLWAVDYLEIVGPAAGVVTIAGLALYLAATSTPRRTGAAMAARMGATRRVRVAVTALEVGAMTMMGWFLGVVLSWIAARFVLPELDPLPRAAPDPLFRYGIGVVLGTAAAAWAAAVIVTLLVEARSERASLPEMLRDGR